MGDDQLDDVQRSAVPHGLMKDLCLFSELLDTDGRGEKISDQRPGVLPEEAAVVDLVGVGVSVSAGFGAGVGPCGAQIRGVACVDCRSRH